MKPRLIAVVGGSGSGKTWLADRLEKTLGPDLCTRLSLDDFYRDLTHLSPARRERINFDNPRAIDWTLFGNVLRRLDAGQTAQIPVYDFATHTRRPEWRLAQPRQWVIVDGLWLLYRTRIRSFFHRSVFLHCPARLRLARRLARDTAERHRTPASVRNQFRRTVQPMHQRFVAPQAARATMVLTGTLTPRHLRDLAGDLLRPSSSDQAP
jgi:uridine kinase